MSVENEGSGEGTSMALSPVPSPSSNEPNTLLVESWCNTHVDVIDLNYLWTINNFSFCPQQMGEVLSSSQFSPATNNKLVWSLRIYPYGLDEDSSDYISLYVKLDECDKPHVTAKFRFTVLCEQNKDNKMLDSKRAYCFLASKDWGFRKFIKRDLISDESSGCLNDDKLTILCELSIGIDCTSTSGRYKCDGPIIFDIPECTLPEDLGSLLEMQSFHDVKLCADDKEFYAHKAILAARSPIFAEKFLHKMEEDGLKTITITDIDPDVLEGLLNFIYSGKVGNIERVALDLLAVADKYDLQRLKIMCERSLYCNLRTDNACNVLVTANLHNADNLKAITMDFIITNALEVMETEGWRSLLTLYPHLISEAFKTLAIKRISPVGPPQKRLKQDSQDAESTT